MANVVVVGSQWGDEGKGKIVDWLSEQADVVARAALGGKVRHDLADDAAELVAMAAKPGGDADLRRLRQPIHDEVLVR